MNTRKPHPVDWYRCPVRADILKSLHERSDVLGWLQSLGYLGTLMVTGGLAFYSAGRWPVPAVIALTLLHGICYAFQINAWKEIAAIQKRQEADPAYQYQATLPTTRLAGY